MIGTIIVNPQKQDRERIDSLLSTDGDIKILAHGKDCYDALKLVGNLKPGIAIMDNLLEFINGEGILPLLRSRSPSTAVVIVVAKISDYQLYKAAYNEVSGIVSKESDLDRLPEILKCISMGNGFISPSLALRVLHLISSFNSKGNEFHAAGSPKFPGKTSDYSEEQFLYSEDPEEYLSKTELKVLAQVGEGNASDEIAKNLSITVGTVRNCISSIMRKTGLHNRAQIVRYAFCSGFVLRNPSCSTCMKKMLL